jgi:hypothetical protein
MKTSYISTDKILASRAAFYNGEPCSQLEVYIKEEELRQGKPQKKEDIKYWKCIQCDLYNHCLYS